MDFDLLCIECRVKMTARSRHCFLCNRCIDNYDHHCDWLNQCIGRANAKPFFAFILTLDLFLVFQLILTSD